MSSAGWDLPAKMIWTGRPARVQDAGEPIGVLEDQLGALVAGESAREPDGQRIRVEQRACRDDARRADVLDGPALPRALADEGEEVAPQRLPHAPELVVRNGEHRVPERRVVVALEPVGAEVLVEQVGELGGDPGRARARRW